MRFSRTNMRLASPNPEIRQSKSHTRSSFLALHNEFFGREVKKRRMKSMHYLIDPVTNQAGL
jgi:hypothetical protein